MATATMGTAWDSLSPRPTRHGDTALGAASTTPGGGGMEQEEVGEREEKEKNEFSCCPSGVAIDRVQAGVERC